jgi:hypothetical protein
VVLEIPATLEKQVQLAKLDQQVLTVLTVLTEIVLHGVVLGTFKHFIMKEML